MLRPDLDGQEERISHSQVFLLVARCGIYEVTGLSSGQGEREGGGRSLYGK